MRDRFHIKISICFPRLYYFDYYNKYKDALIRWNTLVRTFGADTPDIYDGRFSPEIPPLAPVECVNHVGAGDCFAAHLALAMAHSLSLVDAVAIAHSAGRVYVQHPHNRPPTPDEIKKDLSLQEMQ